VGCEGALLDRSATGTGDESVRLQASLTGPFHLRVGSASPAPLHYALWTAVRSSPTSDFDGDGDSDVAVFRPSEGMWYVKDQFSVRWGTDGDAPIRPRQ
jgi:hypothetical protein